MLIFKILAYKENSIYNFTIDCITVTFWYICFQFFSIYVYTHTHIYIQKHLHIFIYMFICAHLCLHTYTFPIQPT